MAKTKKTEETEETEEIEETTQQPQIVGDETLEETPDRALSLLKAAGTNAIIGARMAARGYNAEEHELGWALLRRASGAATALQFTSNVESVRKAIVELDAWDEPGMRIGAAALKHRHPDQYAFVFDGVAPSTGAAVLVGIGKFLDRLDALEDGDDRKETRKADAAALETLAKRGIDKSERKRLRALMSEAQAFNPAAPGNEAAQAKAEAERREALVELRKWYEEWSEVARAVVTRRDHLILLGLAHRKSPKKEPTPKE